MTHMRPRSPLLRTVAVVGLLGGCTPSGDFRPVFDVTAAETGAQAALIGSDESAAEAFEQTRGLLRAALTPQSAVQVALLNNRALQAAYNDLGLAQAELIRGATPANPRFAYTRTQGSGELEIEREILVGLFSLVTLPARSAMTQEKYKAAQMRAAEATLKLAVDARRQYFRAVSAQEKVAALLQAKQLTDAQAQLATKLGETGALNKLDQAREYALAAELDNQLARARLDQRMERERLTRLLGLWGAAVDYRLPSATPTLPARLRSADDVEAQALARRVDLAAARHDLAALGIALGLTQATRLVSDAELLGRTKHVSDQSTGEARNTRAMGLELEIPLFDFGAARSLEAEQRYMRAANLLADKAVTIRSQAREAHAAYRGAWEIARHMEKTILPLRKEIQLESLLHYNGMLKDLSSFIADTRMNILARAQFIDAKRDFWIAESEMRAALAGGGSGVSNVGGGVVSAAAAEGH